MANTLNAAVKTEGRTASSLDTIIEQIRQMGGRVGRCASGLEFHGDKIFGVQPQAEGVAAEEQAEPTIFNSLSQLNDQIIRLEHQLQRLEG